MRFHYLYNREINVFFEFFYNHKTILNFSKMDETEISLR